MNGLSVRIVRIQRSALASEVSVRVEERSGLLTRKGVKRMAKKIKEIKLGERYRDTVHGIEGVAVAIIHHLHGCDRVALELVVEGKIETMWFDLPQIEGIETPKNGKKPGGPGITPPGRIGE